MVAQRHARVVLAEEPTLLQLRDDEPNEIFVGSRNVRRRDDETVAAFLLEPLFQAVGDVPRRAGKEGVLAQFSAIAEVDEVAHGRIALSARGDDVIANRLQSADRFQLLVAERLVETL